MAAWTLLVQIGLAAAPGTASPTWTDVTSNVLVEDGVSFSRGALNGETAQPGSFSFTLKNPNGSTYTGPGLLRRPVRFRAQKGATIYDLGRFHITDAVVLRDGIQRVRVNGTDALATWEEAKRGGDLAWRLTQCGAITRWPLADEGPVGRDVIGNGELVERDYSQGVGSPTYGTVVWGQNNVPRPGGGSAVQLAPADPWYADPGANKGFTGLVAPVRSGKPFGFSCWIRMVEPDATPPIGFDAVALEFRPTGTDEMATVGLQVSFYQNDIDNSPTIGFTTASGTGGSFPAGHTVGWDWVHVDFALSGSNAYAWVTRADGTRWDASSLVATAPTYAPNGYDQVVLGGSPGGHDVGMTAVEIADLIIWDGNATDSGLVRAWVGWPDETPAARLTRAATEASWPTAPTVTATVPAMSGVADTRRSLLDVAREVETATLGLLAVMSDGTIELTARADLDENATSAGSLTAAQVLRDTDGVTTSTGLLVNSSTVTGTEDGVTATYRDTLADTYGDRADDRSMATNDRDWVASSASWLAHRQADPTAAFGLPTLQLDPDKLFLLRGSWDATALLPFTADIGTVVTLPDLLPSSIEVQVFGIAWQITRAGQWVCSWTVRPHARMAYAALDSTATATLDNVVIGW